METARRKGTRGVEPGHRPQAGCVHLGEEAPGSFLPVVQTWPWGPGRFPAGPPWRAQYTARPCCTAGHPGPGRPLGAWTLTIGQQWTGAPEPRADARYLYGRHLSSLQAQDGLDTGPSAGEGTKHREKTGGVPRSLGRARVPRAETRTPKPLCPCGLPLQPDSAGRGVISVTLRHKGSPDTNPEVTHLGPIPRVMPQGLDLAHRRQVPSSVRRQVASVRVGVSCWALQSWVSRC